MGKNSYLNCLLVTKLKLIKCQCLSRTCPIAEECPVSKTTKVVITLKTVDHFIKNKGKHCHLNSLLVTKLKLVLG